MLVCNDVFGNNPFQFLDLCIYVAFGGIVRLVNAQTQTNARICRQICQSHIPCKRILPVGNLFGKNRLGNSSEQQGLMEYWLKVVMLLYQRNYLVFHQVAHLERNTRHGEEEFSISFHHNPRSRANRIVNHRCSCRNKCLTTIVLGKSNTTATKHFGNIGKNRFVQNQLSTKFFADNLLGNVILGRTKSASHKHHIGNFQTPVNGIRNRLAIVANGNHGFGTETYLIHLTRNPRRVYVNNLTYKDFVTYNYDSCIHISDIYSFIEYKSQRTEIFTISY